MVNNSSDDFRHVFSTFDQDGDGKISAAELRLCMKSAAATNTEHGVSEDVLAAMASGDTDSDGLLDEGEFLRLVQAAEEEGDDDRLCREAFGIIRDGRQECRLMICRFDLNGDGMLTFDEFKAMMMG